MKYAIVPVEANEKMENLLNPYICANMRDFISEAPYGGKVGQHQFDSAYDAVAEAILLEMDNESIARAVIEAIGLEIEE